MSIKMIAASAAALALAAGTPAFAAKNQNQPRALASDSGGGAGVDSKAERKICKFIDATESRMKRERLCFTKADWKKFDEEQRQ
jgi:hypothetical protein